MSLTVGVISDLHIEASNVDNGVNEFEQYCEQLLAGTMFAELDSPDELVVIGDFIRDASPAADKEVLEAIGSTLADQPVPVTVTFGNHDLLNVSEHTALDALGCEQSWFADADREVVVLNSGSPRFDDPRGELTAEQVRLVREELSAMDRALVFVHHPLMVRNLTGNPWFEAHPEEAFCGNRRAYLDRGQEGAAIVVSGHLHEPHLFVRNGTVYLGLDAFNKVMGHGYNGACGLVSRTDERLIAAHRSGDGEKRLLERSLSE